MPSIKQHIAKGFYQYSQHNSFISVKNYIFSRVNNKKCLLIRFSNDMEYTVNSMEFTVVQFNGAGNVIGKKKIVYDGINFAAGDTYVAQNGIVVADECRDFKIYFTRVRSGKYKYVVKNGEILVLYDNDPPKEKKKTKAKKSSYSNVTVRKIEKSRQKWSLAAAVIAIAVIVVLSFFNILTEYREAKDLRHTDYSGSKVLAVFDDRYCKNES